MTKQIAEALAAVATIFYNKCGRGETAASAAARAAEVIVKPRAPSAPAAVHATVAPVHRDAK
jgi:hypothetical protein